MTKQEIAAQGQLDAYNDRDIDGFMKWYTGDIKAYDLDKDLCLFEGQEAMRARYSALFENRQLHCHLKNRMVLGGTVIDHEAITRSATEKYEAIAIYDITEEGLIRTVRFSRGRL